MLIRKLLIGASLTAIALFTLVGAQSTPPPRGKANPVFQQPIPNIPGKSLVAVVVNGLLAHDDDVR